MQPQNVSISFVEGNVNEIQHISGMRISNDWILTHGMLLRSKIQRDTKFSELISTLVPGELTHLSTLLSSASSTSSSSSNKIDLRVRVQTRPWMMMMTETNERVPDDIHKTLEEVNGSIIYIWRCPLLADTFENLFFAWRFGEDTRKMNKTLMSLFLLININQHYHHHHHHYQNCRHCDEKNEYSLNELNHENIYRVLSYLIDEKIGLENLERGSSVEIESTPFGNPVFIDSISQGIISNIVGTNNCVMLTDANAVPGCEGGPVYLIQQDKTRIMCGMVIAPLSWCHNEWVYYTFVACIIPCLRRLLRKWENIRNVNGIVEQKLTDLLDESVVLVCCGAEWGSGILLDWNTGTILTCSHVVNEAPSRRIKVVFHRNAIDNHSRTINTWAQLVYRTPKGQPYDVAVLKVDSIDIDSALKTLRISNCNAQRGELVVSAGFPFFSSALPTITRGIISNVNMCMIQTTCCVQNGASGGPIVRYDTGELLGMVVCNVISSNTLYPRLNMAVPAAIFKDPLNQYIETGNADVLEKLTSVDSTVLKTWNFHLTSKI